MGVDHGGGTRGQVSPEFGVGDASANCPPQIFVIYKKERSVAFKIRQNPFSAGALPGPRWGSSRRSLKPPIRSERGHPSPYPHPIRHRPTFGARHASPSEFQPDLIRLCVQPLAFSLALTVVVWRRDRFYFGSLLSRESLFLSLQHPDSYSSFVKFILYSEVLA